MKRIFCVTLTGLFLLTVFCGCSFAGNLSDNTGATKMEALDQVEQMLNALIAGDLDAATALVHSTYPQEDRDTLSQIAHYLEGRSVTDLEQLSLQVNKTSGTGGASRQEQAHFQATLEDGEVIHFLVAYLSQPSEKGFISFQLILGMI